MRDKANECDKPRYGVDLAVLGVPCWQAWAAFRNNFTGQLVNRLGVVLATNGRPSQENLRQNNFGKTCPKTAT